jgi:hypothetical protein
MTSQQSAKQKYRSRPEVQEKEREYRNRPERKARIRELAYRWHRANLPTRMWRTARERAIETGVPFDITPGDIVVPDICPALGIPLRVSDGHCTDNSPTLDRVIPEFGYIPGNICVISMRANRLKNSASIQELESILAYYKMQVEV